MKKLGKLSRLALALLVGGPALARAQIPAVPVAPAAAVPAAAVPAGGVAAVPAAPVAAAPRNIFSFFCPTDAQLAKWKACFCGSQFGQLVNNSMSPVSVFTGGVLPQCCPILDPADLLLPPDSALGAAAQVKKDTLEAAKRRAAIRYMSTADCNWWPEVQAALSNSLRMDRNECVRLEAALALQRGCCCNPTTVRALVNALSPLPTDGNPPEDSPRVRAAAMVALDHCLCCYYGLAVAPPCPKPVAVPVPEELPTPRKEGPPPELPPPPPPPPPPGKGPVVQAEPPLRPVSAARPARDPGMEQLIQEARRVLQKAKERQEAAVRAAAARPQSLTELLEETFHTSPTQAAPLAAGQQKNTPAPTIFSPPTRTQVVEKPSPTPTNTASAGVAARSVVAPPSAPKGNPTIAPVAANDAAPRATSVKTHITEVTGDAFHPSATQAPLPAVGQQKTTPPPTIFSPPARTQVVEKPTPVPPANVAGAPRSVTPPTAPKEPPSLAPAAPSSAPPALTPTPVTPITPSVVPTSTAPKPPASSSPAPLPSPSVVPTPSAAPTLPVSASPAPTATVASAPRSVVAPPSAPKGNPSSAPVAANDAAPRTAGVKTHSITEVVGDAIHPSATQTTPPTVEQQKTTPPPTIASPPTRTQVAEKPSSVPTASAAGARRSIVAPPNAPKGNPSPAPVAASSASPDLTPAPVAPNVPSVVPSSAAPKPTVFSSPAPVRSPTLAETASGAKTQPEKGPALVPPAAAKTQPEKAPAVVQQTVAKTQPEKAPVLVQQTAAKTQPEKVPVSVQQTAVKTQPEKAPALVQQTVAKMQPEKAPVSVQQAAVKTQPEKAPVSIQQTAATPASPQTVSAWQLLLLLRNSTQDDVRAHAANSLADHEKPTPAVVRALVSSAGADASSEVRLACLKTLLKLRVNDPTLPSTLMRLQTDQDSRVRDAAKALHEQLQSRADIPTPPRS